MTRINLVPTEELMDQHLFAEFREIKMVPKALGRSLRAAWQREFDKNDMGDFAEQRAHLAMSAVLQKVPPQYTLNKGHVSFFYDKGEYLRERFEQLREELSVRGYDYDREAVLDSDGMFASLPATFNKHYTPTPDALALVRERIAQRIATKPGWYRYTRPVR